jgi:hypothetical protein
MKDPRLHSTKFLGDLLTEAWSLVAARPGESSQFQSEGGGIYNGQTKMTIQDGIYLSLLKLILKTLGTFLVLIAPHATLMVFLILSAGKPCGEN